MRRRRTTAREIDNEHVEILQASRRQGTYIIAGTGTGKTGLIENLIIQDRVDTRLSAMP